MALLFFLSFNILFFQKGLTYDFEFLHAFLSNKKIRFGQKKWGGAPLHPGWTAGGVLIYDFEFLHALLSNKKWGGGLPFTPQIVIPGWTAGGVRALWVSEHPPWRTNSLYIYYTHMHKSQF